MNFYRKTAMALAISGATMMTSGLAQADGDGWMIGGGAYYSDIDDRLNVDRDDFERERLSFNSSSGSFNLGGGYRFNKWLAIDGGYWDFGNFESDRDDDGNREKFDATAWTLGGMVSVPLWIMDFYAKAGAAFWEYDGRNVDTDGTDPYFGLGAAFNIGGSLDIYGEWVRFDQDAKMDSFGVGVRYTF